MPVYLIDTSVWVEVFRKPSRFDLQSVIDIDSIVTCLPVVQEVLQGFLDQRAHRVAREALLSFPIVESPLPWALFDEAIELYRRARRAGLTPRSSMDCLIAACCLRHQLTVLHCDRDYTLLARVAPLQEKRIQLR